MVMGDGVNSTFENPVFGDLSRASTSEQEVQQMMQEDLQDDYEHVASGYAFNVSGPHEIPQLRVRRPVAPTSRGGSAEAFLAPVRRFPLSISASVKTVVTCLRCVGVLTDEAPQMTFGPNFTVLSCAFLSKADKHGRGSGGQPLEDTALETSVSTTDRTRDGLQEFARVRPLEAAAAWLVLWI